MTVVVKAQVTNLRQHGDYTKHFDIPQGQVWVHHAVERQAMTKHYKNLGLTDAELNSLESLRGIPTDINYDIHLSKIRKKWTDFYEANPDGPNMTKQKLLDYAKEIDDEFGHLFLPPVR